MVWLELSWQADAPRLVQIPAPPRQGAGSTLAKQIQHALRQMALIGLDQQGFERVVEFQMATRAQGSGLPDDCAGADGPTQQSAAVG